MKQQKQKELSEPEQELMIRRALLNASVQDDLTLTTVRRMGITRTSMEPFTDRYTNVTRPLHHRHIDVAPGP